jgi:PDZ domain-containing protein
MIANDAQIHESKPYCLTRWSGFLLLFLAISGCSSSTRTGRWGDWAKVPEPENRIDSVVHFENFKTFTILPYSQLAPDIVVAGQDENMEMFGLANSIMKRGYRYVDNLDSADFVLIEKISDDYDPAVPLRSALETVPVFRNVLPFSISNNPFGDSAQRPQNIIRPPSHPLVKIFIYTKDGRLLNRWGSGGIFRDVILTHSSLYLMSTFQDDFPPSKFIQTNLPLGTGRLGIGLDIWSRDAINYWPEIQDIQPGSPADKAGLKFGDLILDINGRNAKNIDFRELYRRIRGDAGDTVSLKILHWSGMIENYNLVFAPVSK